MRAEIVKDSEPARSNYIIDIQNSHWQINTNEWQQSGNFHCLDEDGKWKEGSPFV